MSVVALSEITPLSQSASPKTPFESEVSWDRLPSPVDEGHVPLSASYGQPACKGARIPACSAAGFH